LRLTEKSEWAWVLGRRRFEGFGWELNKRLRSENQISLSGDVASMRFFHLSRGFFTA